MNMPSEGTEPPLALKALLALATAAFGVQVLLNYMGGYGYFIDEWYYIACANRLSFGYVDHPPLAPLLLKASMLIGGTSLASIRFLPALAGAATVLLTGLMARELGGRTFAQCVAALSTLGAPAVLVMCGFFSVNCFEIFFWVACTFVLLMILKRGRSELWVAFGVLMGIGLENKHTIILLAFAVGLGLLLSPARREFTRKEFWFGAGAALLILLPNIIWQIRNGWPSLEFYANATIYKNIPTPPLKGLLNLIVLQNPATLPVWGFGLGFLLVGQAGRPFRSAGLMCAALLLAQLLSQSSRPDRISGIYPTLFAAGGVAFERLWVTKKAMVLRGALLALLCAGTVALAPIALPVLSPGSLASYSQALGVVPRLEKGKTSPLPQWFADRFEWDNVVAAVKEASDGLSPEERARAAIFAPSYGHAGCLEFYGPGLGLPRVICNHNSYYLWCKGKANADVLIAMGWKPGDLRSVYARVDSVGLIRGKYAMSWRINMPVYIARQPKIPMDSIWSRIKSYG